MSFSTTKARIFQSSLLWLPLLFVAGLLVVKVITHIATTRAERHYQPKGNVVLSAYEDKVAEERDTGKLAKVADGLMNKNMPAYALLNFKQASEIDPNYRDMAYGWAYCLLQTKQSTLSSDDLKELHSAMDRAEAVDPSYMPLLKLKIIVAKIENKTEVVNATQARLDLLTKH